MPQLTSINRRIELSWVMEVEVIEWGWRQQQTKKKSLIWLSFSTFSSFSFNPNTTTWMGNLYHENFHWSLVVFFLLCSHITTYIQSNPSKHVHNDTLTSSLKAGKESRITFMCGLVYELDVMWCVFGCQLQQKLSITIIIIITERMYNEELNEERKKSLKFDIRKMKATLEELIELIKYSKYNTAPWRAHKNRWKKSFFPPFPFS